MNVIATIDSDGSEFALTKIYGLTILERTIHALERAEIASIYVQSKDREVERIVAKTKWKSTIFINKEPENIDNDVLHFSQAVAIAPDLIKNWVENTKEGVAQTPDKMVSFYKKNRKEASLSATLSTNESLYCTIEEKKDIKIAKKALIKSLSKPTDGWVSRNLNRPISTTVTRAIVGTGITPNQFTVITGLIGLATGVFLAMGGYINFLIGGLLFHLTSVFDGVDGELARLKFKSSPFGQWLDTLVDNLSYLAGLAGIIIGIYRTGASDFVLYSGIAAIIFAVAALLSLYFYLIRFKRGGTLLNVEYGFLTGTTSFDKIMRTAAAFGKRDLFALLFFFLGLLGIMPYAVVYVCIMAAFVFAFSIQAHITTAVKN